MDIKFRVKMPQKVQDHLGVKPGDTIFFNDREDGTVGIAKE